MADIYENVEFDYTAKIAGISKKVNNLIPNYTGGLSTWISSVLTNPASRAAQGRHCRRRARYRRGAADGSGDWSTWWALTDMQFRTMEDESRRLPPTQRPKIDAKLQRYRSELDALVSKLV